MRAAEITAVINLYGYANTVLNDHVLYVLWRFPDNADDNPVMPDTKTLNALVDFIVGLMAARHRVLIHCMAGMNRSAMVAALVLKKHERITGRMAVERIRHARHSDALFNKVFHDHVVNSL